MSFPHYFESFDYAQMLRDFPVGDAFTAGFALRSRDEIHAHQNRLFMQCMARAWEIPFYQRLWRAQGLSPADVRSIEDIGLTTISSVSNTLSTTMPKF